MINAWHPTLVIHNCHFFSRHSSLSTAVTLFYCCMQLSSKFMSQSVSRVIATCTPLSLHLQKSKSIHFCILFFIIFPIYVHVCMLHVYLDFFMIEACRDGELIYVCCMYIFVCCWRKLNYCFERSLLLQVDGCLWWLIGKLWFWKNKFRYAYNTLQRVWEQ